MGWGAVGGKDGQEVMMTVEALCTSQQKEPSGPKPEILLVPVS